MTVECAEPHSLAPPQDVDSSSKSCSALALTGCAGALVGITIACGGPEDLPCIAAALSAVGGCGACICKLIGFKCALAPTNGTPEDSLPKVEFGTCSELGFAIPHETLHMEQGGFNVAVHVHSPDVQVEKLHQLDVPVADSCSEVSASDQTKLTSDTTFAAGSCVDAGFPLFDSFGFVPAVATGEMNGGCGAIQISECSAALIGITIACGGPEDLPCIAAALSLVGGCGECVCNLVGLKCGGFPVEVFKAAGSLTV